MYAATSLLWHPDRTADGTFSSSGFASEAPVSVSPVRKIEASVTTSRRTSCRLSTREPGCRRSSAR